MHYFSRSFVAIIILLSMIATAGKDSLFAQDPSISFSTSGLLGGNVNNPTSLQFGPDGRLYVSEQYGKIHIFNVVRNGPNDYQVTDSELITLIQQIPNHNDDGTVHTGSSARQVTGILVEGTPASPILYVASSDYRIGAGSGGNDLGLDTNSGIISRLTWNGTSWDKIDLVRGLPRSEENHSVNGMQYDAASNTLYVAVGGNTNAGSPSNNFVFSTEYALAAAIVSIDLTTIDAMAVNGSGNNKFIYDLPTVDDPTRPNTGPNGSDENDPFGGNDGLNQAKIVTGGPVQIYASGFRNAYDIVLTATGKLYTVDNGANGGWGGHPDGEGTANCTNDYLPGEPGSKSPGPGGDDEVNNLDNLHFISQPGYYGGHPVPVRGNPTGAGLYTHDGNSGVWRTSTSGENPLPADWPPVPSADPQQCDFRNAGVDDGALATFAHSTNGLAEYTASNFGGALQGDLLTASFDGTIYRMILGNGGTTATKSVFASNVGLIPLDVIAQADGAPFEGTVWAATYGEDSITVFEPADYDGNNPGTCLGTDDPALDEDADGFSNADEIDNGTNPCSGADKPADNDGDQVSDLNDSDDDNDTIPDTVDLFAIDPDNGLATDIPLFYPFFNADPGTGFFGLGFTGLMSDGTSDYQALYPDSDANIIAGGTAGLFTAEVVGGDATGTSNNQLYAFQFGINVDSTTPGFDVRVQTVPPFFDSAPTGNQNQGMYIGTGDQDNYLKVVVHANNGSGGVQVLGENGGVVTSDGVYPIANLLTATEVNLFITVNPADGTAQPKVQLENNAVQSLGSPVPLQSNLLTALQSSAQALAVGVIGSSSGSPDFGATWDEVEITYNTQTSSANLSTDLSSLHFFSQAVGTSSGSQSLVVENLGTDSIVVNGVSMAGPHPSDFDSSFNDPVVLAGGESTTLDVVFVPTATGIRAADLLIEHTGLNTPLIVKLTGEGIPAPVSQEVTLFRVNAAGPELAPANGVGPNWSGDSDAQPSPYLTNGENIYAPVGVSVTPDGSVPPTVPIALFKTERYQAGSSSTPIENEMKWSFPVDAGTPVEIRLYMAEMFHSQAGARIFDVDVDGAVPPLFDNIDLYETVGFKIGTMKSFTTTSDGSVDLTFIRIVENPNIQGLEILDLTPNEPPSVVSAINDLQVDEDAAPTDIALNGVFDDPEDGTNLSYAVANNTNTALIAATINGSNLTLTYAPNGFGVADISILAYDSGAASVVDTFQVDVANVNDAPKLGDLNSASVEEGETASLLITASDSDGDSLIFAHGELPGGATLSDNGDGTATFTWITNYTDAGSYNVAVNVSDPAGSKAEGTFSIQVNDVNQPPVFDAIQDVSINEGEVLNIIISATDMDNDLLTLTATGLPAGVTFADGGNGTGSLDLMPGYDTQGTYDVTFSVTDNINTGVSAEVKLIIGNVNRQPIWTPVGTQTAVLGEVLSVPVTASDPDGDTLLLSLASGPTGVEFTDNGNGTGTLNWAITDADLGNHLVSLTAKDSAGAMTSLSVEINVTDVTRAPQLDEIGLVTIQEGEIVTIIVKAIDPDADLITLSLTDAPTYASLIDNGDGTGVLTLTPDFTDAGNRIFMVVAADQFAASSTTPVVVQVLNVNRAPTFAGLKKQLAEPDADVSLSISAADPDGDPVTLNAVNLPAGATFISEGSSAGTFIWRTPADDDVVYNAVFKASDDKGLSTEESFQIIVGDPPLPPVIAPIPDQRLTGMQPIVQPITATDPNGDLVSLIVSGLPTDAVFTDNKDGTGTILWPLSVPVGAYTVTVIATDAGNLASSTRFVATVAWTNQPPVYQGEPTGVSLDVAAGKLFTHQLKFVDPDNDSVTLSLVPENLPQGITLTDNQDGTGTLQWLTSESERGNYVVKVRATDAQGLSTEVSISLSVENQSQSLKIFAPIVH